MSLCRKDAQTWLLRGSKSRNKVSVGEPAEGSLPWFTSQVKKKRHEMVVIIVYWNHPLMICQILKLLGYGFTLIQRNLFVRIWGSNYFLCTLVDTPCTNASWVCKSKYWSSKLTRVLRIMIYSVVTLGNAIWNFKKCILKYYNKNKQKINLEWWITRLVGRWRTQLTACRRVNCRTHEHRHFERKWRLKITFKPRLAEGRIWNKQ